MRLFSTMDEYARECRGCVVALGMFDGVHLGHKALLDAAVARAKLLGVDAAALTYEQSPTRVLFPQRAPLDIQTLSEKISSMSALGIDAVICEKFTPEYAALSGEEFARALKEKLDARAVVIGYNYSFGDKGACGAADLRRFGAQFGFEVIVVDPINVLGGAVSSTRIREKLAEGDIWAVNAMLGRHYELSGPVMPGKHIGHKLGFATANLNMEPERALAHAGVYICAVCFGGEWLPGVLNIGSQPTLPSGGTTCEVHALCEIGDVYGLHMRVRFIKFGRPERKFSSVDELRAQVERDKAQARAFFVEHPISSFVC